MQAKTFIKAKTFIALLLMAFLTIGCYFNDNVGTDQVGIQLNGGRIENCVGPGVYTSMGFFADLQEVSAGTLTFSVEDPEVLTSDNQPVGERITIQARRNSDCESVKNLLTNWPQLINDQALVDTVSATAREGMKVGTRSFTLPQLLDDRNGLANGIMAQLEEDAMKYGVDIVNVTIENIAPSPEYVSLLQQKANYGASVDAEKKKQELIKQQAANQQLEQQQRTTTLGEQLKAEQAQTSVEVEIAQREGEKVAAAQMIYTENEQAFELRRLELMAKNLR